MDIAKKAYLLLADGTLFEGTAVGYEGQSIGEVVFGKISQNFGFKLFSVAFGAIIYYLVLQIVLWMGLNSNDLKLLSALVVAVFLAIPYMKGKYFSKPVK